MIDYQEDNGQGFKESETSIDSMSEEQKKDEEERSMDQCSCTQPKPLFRMASINCLPISPKIRLGLMQIGLTNAKEILALTVDTLAQSLKISESEAKSVQEHIQSALRFDRMPMTVAELLVAEEQKGSIVTMCKDFDEMLGCGIPSGRLTELCGAAGVGKTQFCFQICVTVQLPACVGGLCGDAIYIDTEGSFSVRRISQIAEACIKHCRTAISAAEGSTNISSLNVEDFLKGIRYIRCSESDQLLALSYRLPALIETSAVKLIVIDSIAFHFRYDCEDLILRNRHLGIIAQNLFKVLQTKDVSIVVTNQMTTRFDAGGSGYLAPALGESWAHVSAIKVLLDREPEGRKRTATLVKHPSKPERTCFYQVTSGGIRDFV